MSISERTLKKWRKEALKDTLIEWKTASEYIEVLDSRILQMTQILLDQHLLNKGK